MSQIGEVQPLRPSRHGAGSGHGRSETIELRLDEILRVILRRKWWLIGALLVIIPLGKLWIDSQPLGYTAMATVMIEPAEADPLNAVTGFMQGLTPDVQTIATEIEVIRSTDVAIAAIEQTGIAESEEFNPMLDTSISWQKYIEDWRLWTPDSWHETLYGVLWEPPAERDIPPEVLSVIIVNRFLSRLDAGPLGNSRAIAIEFTAENRHLAQRVANTVADLYIVQNIEAQFEAAERASEWLNERISLLRTDVVAAEQAIEQLRQTITIDGVDPDTLSDQIARLNGELITARGELQSLRARLAEVEAQERVGGAASVFEIIDSAVINDLRGRQTGLIQERAALSSQYAAQHPQMLELQSEINSLGGQIAQQAQVLINGWRSEVSVARQRVERLEEEVESRIAISGDFSGALVQLAAMERDAEAKRGLLENMLNRAQEMGQQLQIDEPDVVLLSPAALPLSPSEPKAGLLMMLVIVAALGIGFVLMFIVEMFDSGYRQVDEIEADLDIHGLSTVPLIPNRWWQGRSRRNHVMVKPRSMYAEAIRSLYTSLKIHQQRDNTGNAVLVTSALPGEGKSFTTVNLARVVARSGERVVVLDCDQRRPTVHTLAGVNNDTGLSAYIAGRATYDEVLQIDEESGAHIISAGSQTLDPEVAFRSPAMNYLLSRLRTQYDLVLIDTPPILPVSDARVLASSVDLAVLVTRWRKTPRRAVSDAVRLLNGTGCAVAGIVLNRVAVGGSILYGYKNVAYSQGKAAGYYQ